jgi:hypothetical protein
MKFRWYHRDSIMSLCSACIKKIKVPFEIIRSTLILRDKYKDGSPKCERYGIFGRFDTK